MKLPNRNRYNRPERILFTGLLIILLFISQPLAYGQRARNEPPPLKDRLFYGGSFGLQFGTYTDIDFSPVIGIWMLPRVAIAAGPDFRYYKDPYDKTTIYGGKAYIEFMFLQDMDNLIPLGLHLGLYLHGEYEVLSLESSFFKLPPYDSDRFINSTFLAGGGIRQPLGRRSSLNLTFLWAVNESGYGFYGNPEIRLSFMF